MKPEIKQRIEQLNNGKIPKGYKKTDFGVFPSDWVTDKKLIDIGIFGKGKGIPGNKMQSDGVPCVGYGDIYMKYNHFHFEEAQSFVDEETAKDSQLIKKGTLLFTGTGETAEEIGKCVCYNGYSTICAGGDIITFVPQDVNPLFLAYQQYQNFSLKKKASFGQGHSVVHIQKESLEKLNVAYPESKNEQSRIVEILMKWDKAIELYDKQIDALTRYKAVCLKKMFPIKGQSVPEWRFHGFSGDWEQRKLEDFGKATGGTSIESEFSEDGIYKVISIGSYSENSVYNDQGIRAIKSDKTSNRVLNRNDLTMILNDKTTSGNIIGRVLLIEESGIYVYNQRTERIEINLDEYDSVFLYEMLNAPNIREKIIKQAQGNTQIYVNWTAISLLKYMIPSKEEQVKIGEYLHSISNLITLHQHKKEVITNQRKTLQQYLLNGIIRV